MRSLNFFLTVSTGLAALVSGQNNRWAYKGGFNYASAAEPHNYDLFVSVSQSANTTRSVPIPGAPGLIWRVNVSSVSVPDARPLDSGEPPLLDPQVVQTVFDLQFPGQGSLNSYINQTEDGPPRTVCVTVFSPQMLDYDLPLSVIDQYNEEDNGDCGNVLGEDCVAAFLRSGKALDRPPGCLSFVYNLPECNNTLREAIQQTTSTSFSLGNGYARNGTKSVGQLYNETQSGLGFYSTQTNAVNGSNTTAFNIAENRLQIIGLYNLVPGQRQLLCQRVSINRKSSGDRIGASWTTGTVLVGGAIMAALL